MYCRYCGKELPDDSRFCPNCGKKQIESDDTVSSNELILRVKDFVQKHRKLVYFYLAWFLLHLTLFISSEKYDYSNEQFYPFDMTLSKVIQGGTTYRYPGVEFLDDSLNYYDFTEFFAYVVLLPIITFGIVRLYPHRNELVKNIKSCFCRWQEENAKKVKEYQEWQKQIKEASVKDNLNHKEESLPPVDGVCQEFDNNIENVEQEVFDTLDQANEDSQEKKNEEDALVKGINKLPIFQRFAGSLMDKVIILVSFVVIFFIISPYGAAGKLGTYSGLFNASPNNYEYIDKAAMNRYGTYEEGVSRYYQDMERLDNEPPHIGSTMELDISITFSFILLNLIYYILFESLIASSPGKKIFGGQIVNSIGEKIGFGLVLFRGICGGLLMSGVYCLIHLLIGFSNHLVLYVFFFLMDIPVLFIKRSLLDLCTSTIYVKK